MPTLTPSTSQPPDVPAGRPRTAANRDLPPGLKRRAGKKGPRYYYIHASGYQQPLGSDFDKALEQYPRLRAADKAKTTSGGFSAVANAFEREYLPGLALKTQREYENGLKALRAVFKDAPLESITPGAVGGLKRELRDTKVAFNRLKSLLSVLWNWARECGITAAPNPCVGVKGYSERARDVVVTDAMYFAVYDRGEQAMRDWMDLTITAGPRVSDVLRILRPTPEQLAAGEFHVYHGKRTRRVVRVGYEGDLRTVVERILARTRGIASVYLIHDERGQPYNYWQLRDMFDAARTAAGQTYQMRDLRPKSATDAKTLEEAGDRLAHEDLRTTRRVYRRILRAHPGKLPSR